MKHLPELLLLLPPPGEVLQIAFALKIDNAAAAVCLFMEKGLRRRLRVTKNILLPDGSILQSSKCGMDSSPHVRRSMYRRDIQAAADLQAKTKTKTKTKSRKPKQRSSATWYRSARFLLPSADGWLPRQLRRRLRQRPRQRRPTFVIRRLYKNGPRRCQPLKVVLKTDRTGENAAHRSGLRTSQILRSSDLQIPQIHIFFLDIFFFVRVLQGREPRKPPKKNHKTNSSANKRIQESRICETVPNSKEIFETQSCSSPPDNATSTRGE